ncbi:MAG: hypothetical protein LBU89_05830 [Fibromonadaceae bacterium]|jgi:hypothetical protein|nr:hypothetical protein [Fibromonadaceae bacterium]
MNYKSGILRTRINKLFFYLAAVFMLLLSCNEDEKSKQAEEKNNQVEEICDSSCIKRNNFQLSTTKLAFVVTKRFGNFKPRPSAATGGISVKNLYILADRTATGAFIRYKPWSKSNSSELLEIELNMEEWLNVTRDLYDCCISEWGEKYNKLVTKHVEDSLFKINFSQSYPPLPDWAREHRNNWMLEVSSDGVTNRFEGYDEDPHNWYKLLSTMFRTTEKTGIKLHHEVRFINTKARTVEMTEAQKERYKGIDSEIIEEIYIEEEGRWQIVP